MKIKFGPVTASEIEVMLDAAQSDPIAASILAKYYANGGVTRREFVLSTEEAEYLRDNLWGDADRVAQACGDAAAGRAYEKAGDNLDTLIKRETTD